MATHETRRYPITVANRDEARQVIDECRKQLADMRQKLSEVYRQVTYMPYGGNDVSDVARIARGQNELDHACTNIYQVERDLSSAYWFLYDNWK